MRRMVGVRALPVGVRQYGVPGWFVSGGFSPAQVPGLTLWLDASDAETLFQDSAQSLPAVADGDPVGCWRDKAWGTYDALQATSAKRPTLRLGVAGGQASLEFDGTDDYLAVTRMTGEFGGGFTYFVVMRVVETRPTSFMRPIGGRLGGTTQSYFDTVLLTGGALQQTVRIDGNVYAAGIHSYGVDETGYNLLACRAEPNESMTCYYNGDSTGTVSLAGGTWAHIASVPAETPYLGALNNNGTDNGHFLGNMAEVLIYNGPLSTGHRRQVERYLMEKYGVAA